jgi:HSP20 family molecular chaperone IbpA
MERIIFYRRVDSMTYYLNKVFAELAGLGKDLGKEMEEAYPLWSDLWSTMTTSVSKLPGKLLSGTFPPCNYYAEKDGTLHFQFAVAGYKESEIDLSFADDHMILKLKPEEKKEGEEFKWFQKGIRSATAETKAFVPFSKYAVDSATVILENGMLSVDIKMKEEAKPINVKINKK